MTKIDDVLGIANGAGTTDLYMHGSSVLMMRQPMGEGFISVIETVRCAGDPSRLYSLRGRGQPVTLGA